jgi:two-component system, OmpR family, KDP operon response regulator KdpE
MPKPANTVLVIDDESQIRRFIVAGLKLHGYVVREAENAAAGLSAVVHLRPDLVILDLGLPDANGIEVLKTIRSWSNMPVIVLSVHADEELKVDLLKHGADDYVVKPFGIAELAARCEAALRRYHKTAERSPLMRTGGLAIDLVSRSVLLDGKPITLTRKEYRLLHLLASHLGLVLTHNQLIRDIWRNSSPDNIQYLRMLVRRLRQKIEDDPGQPTLLISISGVGYRLEQLAPTEPSP